MPPGALALLLSIGLVACGGGGSEPLADDVPVHVGTVGLDEHSAPVVVLEEERGSRELRIWIGISEAHSIAQARGERTPPRPNSHDLAKRMIDGVHGRVTRVVVSDLRDGIFYAVLSLEAAGNAVQIDARPSDAIAIALRMGAPIYVRSTVFDAAGEPTPPSAATGRAIRWRAPDGAEPQASAPVTH